jgi:hypothetical protein
MVATGINPLQKAELLLCLTAEDLTEVFQYYGITEIDQQMDSLQDVMGIKEIHYLNEQIGQEKLKFLFEIFVDGSWRLAK